MDRDHLKSTFAIAFALFSMLILSGAGALARTMAPGESLNISLYKKLAPGVVNIISTMVSFDFFFNPVPESGSGSGSIIDKQGRILTNSHVVDKAQRLEVTLYDGSRWPAKIVGTDPETDLAVIKIDAPASKLQVIPMGDSSDLEVGQNVLAIGNPFGLQGTLTVGIISSLGRTIRASSGELMEGVIQTDAAINPGNSGGPLIDSSGMMIGINSAILSPSGGNIGIGFAIPMNIAKPIIKELIERGYVARPWLGITGQTLVPEVAKALRLPVERGVMVADVVPGASAQRSGVRGGARQLLVGNLIMVVGGDIITSVDGKKVETMEDLGNIIRGKKPGDKIEISVYRGDKPLNLTVILTERPRQRS